MELITCPSSKQIDQYVRGQIDGPLGEQIAEHIKNCSRCLHAVANPGAPPPQPSVHDTVTAGGAAMERGWSSPLSDSVETYSLSFLAPAVDGDELGWLANYRVLKVLGEGGMGMVLLAEDAKLKRPVALKVMKNEIKIYPDAKDRFMREAMSMAQVKSEHVVTIHQVGEFNDTCFIAMELLDGESLDDYMSRDTRAPVGEALRIGREIALALMAAHAKGLIHRDIKPENVWLESPHGRVKLLDFGLARPQVVADNKLTMTGMIMGTPSYMSPEQAHAREIDERSDLWSLGCLLYQLVCGHKPFEAPTLMATLMAIVEHEPPPPSDYYVDLPQGMDTLVMRLLAKDCEQRWQTASDVIECIKEIEGRMPMASGGATAARPGGATAAGPGSGGFRLGGTVGSIVGGASRSINFSAAQDREAERRQLCMIVCSCDIFDSTEYSELDGEDQLKILGVIIDVYKDVVLRFGGTVVQCSEESMLACFGYPTALDESTVLAARCALGIVDALKPVCERLQKEFAVTLGAKIGLHTGTAVCETKGNEISVVGEARKVALKVTDHPFEAQVVCSDASQRLLRGRFDCKDLGQHKVKGLSQPISICEIKAESASQSQVDPATPAGGVRLVGRDLEMSLLKDRWAQAEEGMGQVVLLGGEAGVGKSHIVQATKHYVKACIDEGKKVAIVEWFCSPHFRNTPLHPASSFFEHLLQFEQGEKPAAKYEKLVAHLKQHGLAQLDVVPIFASLLNLPSSEKFPSLILTPAREREEIFRALKEWLRAFSAEQTVFFVIEDLHWLDDSTLQFLGELLNDISSEQVLTLLTFRPEFRIPWPLGAQQTNISLTRLTKQQASDLVHRRIGRAVPEAVVAQICERAGGVPLFIEEFTRMVMDSGLLDQAEPDGKGVKTLMARAIPSTLQELIMARLDRLEGDSSLAQLAASIGRNFSYELLLEVSGLEELVLQAELAKLVQGDLLTEKGRPPKSTYTFKHVLLQDALYNAMVKGKRWQFHQRIAETLEARQVQHGDVLPEILAHHFTGAAMIEKSIIHWLAAGLRAQEQFANVEAISHFTAGLDLLGMLPETSDRDNSELLFLNPLGSSYQAAMGYSAPVVGPLFARAKALCQKVGEPWQLFVIMWGNWTWHLVRGDLSLCLELADEMMALADSTGDSGMQMEAYVAPAVTRLYRGDFAGCAHYCKEAILHYENAEQCRLWATRTGQNAAVVIRCYLALSLWHLGYPDRASELVEEMMSMAQKGEHPFSLGHAYHFANWFYRHCRLGEKLEASASEQVALATQQGYALWVASGTFFRGAGILLQGRNEEGVKVMESGLQMFKAANATLTLAAQFAVLSEGYIKIGEFEKARKSLSEGLALANKHEDRYQEAELHRLTGELILAENGKGEAEQKEAGQCFRNAIELARSQQSRAWELRATVSLARLLQKQGRAEEAKKELGAIYGAYEEGLHLPDLVAAKELLASI